MKNKLNNFYLLILISYLTLILGFLFNENITSGATDWPHVSKMITRFAENFQNYLQFMKIGIHHFYILFYQGLRKLV